MGLFFCCVVVMAGKVQRQLFPLPEYDIRMSNIQRYVEYTCEEYLDEVLEICRTALSRKGVARLPTNLNNFLGVNLPKNISRKLDIEQNIKVSSGIKKARNLWAHTFLYSLLEHLNEKGYVSYNKNSGLISVKSKQQ